MAAIKDAQALLEKLRAAYGKGDFAGAKATYDQLKVRDGERRERRRTDSRCLVSVPLTHTRARTLASQNPQVKLIQLPALPPTFERTPTAQQELLIGRE